MIKRCQNEMIDSDTSRELEVARGTMHPIFETTSQHRTCLAQWIIGSTDIFENITTKV
jgi:hypothetical protein